jgi:hypothetical protein
MVRGTGHTYEYGETKPDILGVPILWFFVAAILTIFLLLLLMSLTGLSLSFFQGLFLFLFGLLPVFVYFKPRSFGYCLALFLPLQQILLCLAFMYHREWAVIIKWILGWKDLGIVIVLAAALFRKGANIRPKTNWERWILIFFVFMLLMLARFKFPFLPSLASFRFYMIPFLLLLAGFYSGLDVPAIRSLLILIFVVSAVVMIFGIFEVYVLKESFFVKYLDIGPFKTSVQETGQALHTGAYLYAPGFLLKRRMVSTFLGATPLGHYLSFVLCLFLACLHANLWKDRPALHMSFILLAVFSIYLTASRLAMAEALIAGAFFTLIAERPQRIRYFVLGTISVLGVFALSGPDIARVALATLSVKDSSTMVHLQSVLNTPFSLFGMGLGAGANVFTSKGPYIVGEGIFNRTLIETGILGFGVFVGLYGAILRAAASYRCPNPETENDRFVQAFTSAGVVYGIIIIPSTFITIDAFSTVSLGLFWFLLGLGFGQHPANLSRTIS